MEQDWETVVCIPQREYRALKDEKTRLEALTRRQRRRMGWVLSLCLGLLTSVGFATMITIAAVNNMQSTQEIADQCGAERQSMSNALGAMTRTHISLLDAKEMIGKIGSDQAWGRKFHVTQYAPSAGGINADSDPDTTSTMRKANPANRIVAVDPGVVPYGSWVWIEDLGWYEAQDTGGAIKGFKLDVMVHRSKDAMQWGRQDRFVLVVPPTQHEQRAGL